jgi:hypothetical protein
MDQSAILDHQFVVAAYAITWAIQLGYVAWLLLKWRAQKRAAPARSFIALCLHQAGAPQVSPCETWDNTHSCGRHLRQRTGCSH